MIIWLLSIACSVLLLMTIFSTYYMIRFMRYVMAIEDVLSEAVEIHERSMESFEKILGMKLFFDSPEVKAVVLEVIEDIKICKLATQKVIQSFLKLSKNKYVLETEE